MSKTIWTDADIEQLRELYPLYGKHAKIEGKYPYQIATKANGLKIKMLPAAKRKKRIDQTRELRS